MKYPILFGAILAVVLGACSKEEPAAPAPAPLAAPKFDAASVARGQALFAQNCAECHGPQAQGHPDWQTPSDSQFAAAPPLNGTGRDWKQTRGQLAATIAAGVRRKSDNSEIMPAWKGRFSTRDFDDVLNYLQSLWSPEVYEAWHKTQAGAAPRG